MTADSRSTRPRPLRRLSLWSGYLVIGLAAILVFLVLPPQSTEALGLHFVILGSVVPVLWLGLRRHRPEQRMPWLLLLVAYVFLLAGNAARYLAPEATTPLTSDPLASGMFLAAYVAIAFGLASLARTRRASGDLGALTDAVLVATAIGLAWFEFVVGAHLALPTTSPEHAILALMYPLPGLLFVALVLWLVFASGTRGVALGLLIAGIALQALADGLLGASELGAWSTGGIERPLWIASALLVGAAALHPSMATVATASLTPSPISAGRRIYLLASVSLVVPLSLVRHSSEAGHGVTLTVGLTAAAFMVLVFLRLRGLVVDVDAYRRAEVDVRRLNDSLASQVAERTAQLAATNETLRVRERELVDSGAFLEGVVDTVPGIIFRGRLVDGALDYVSPTAERLLGWSVASSDGRSVSWDQLIHPDDLAVLRAQSEAAREQGTEAYAVEFRARHTDGSYRWFLSNIRFLGDGTGPLAGIVGTAVDISERKAAEEALRGALEEAARASQAKSAFLSSASHELRTPLNAVLGFAQLLDRPNLPERDRESVAQIVRGGRSLLVMIDGLLELGRIESGRFTFSIEPVSVQDVVTEAVDLIRPRAAERDIRLVLPPPTEPPPMVLADRTRLVQVILSLLTNAVTYDREGGSVAVTYAPVEGDRLRLSVADTGPGITPERQATLFSPFDRHADKLQRPVGLGVGLALSARLMEAMNGSIGVESEVGVGSTFSIALPLAREAVAGAAAGSEGATGLTLAETTILYVEDNLANLALVEQILQARPGTQLLAAMQGRLGLHLARQHRPRLILLDLQLPDMSGEDVLRSLREDGVTRSIPVIVLSSTPGVGGGRRLRELGAVTVLTKPLDVLAFLRAVDAALAVELDDG